MKSEVRYLYGDLIEAQALLPDVRGAYQRLNQVMYRAVNLALADSRVNFSGTFAKVDYLLKENKGSKQLSQRVNDTRVRLRMRASLDEADLMRYFYYDFKSIGLLISLVYHVDAPKDVTAYYRDDEWLRRPSRRLIGEYLRAIVERVDDAYIYCHADDYLDGATLKVCYAHGNFYYRGDWSYLKVMLEPSMQINLVMPRIDGGIIYPELIIVEPDQLINVTTVAGCFTTYADSRYVDLIRRLQEVPQSEPILLGNFAGQLLDETIHQSDNTYTDSAKEFFKHHAMSMVTLDVSPQFHADARKQQSNIRAAINTALPWTLSRFDSKNGIVEPSFFSEMLGLQGRMDFLQLDYKVLLEQKAGKGEYPQGDYSKPRHRIEHYVQLLLYMLIIRYNFRKAFDENSRELHAFLLYSKYSEGLIDMGFSPDLVFQAVRIRNELAWANIRYSQPGGMRELLTLTPESINIKRNFGTLWQHYQRPAILEVLNPIHQASEVERDYYFRLLDFVAAEYMVSKVGTAERECSGFASTWHDSLEDKRQAGNIYDNLTLILPEEGAGAIETVSLRFAETECNDMSNFRKGDVVILYPYSPGTEPDARRTMVFRCSISHIKADTVILKLRAPQSDARAFGHQAGKLWAIEHDFIETTFLTQFAGVQSFLTAPQSRRDLLMMRRKPAVDTTLTLKGHYGAFDTLMLRVKQARDIFLIIGPPGTGKTSYGLLNTLKEELLEPDSAVLLVSYTNRAVDEICSKLVEDGIDFVRIGSELGCAEEYKPYLLSTRAAELPKLNQIKTFIGGMRVFVGTTSAINANKQIFDLRRFSLAIVDEASQILEPHIITLLSAKSGDRSAVTKFVLIGDHKQLPAVVQQPKSQSAVTEPSLRAIGMTDCRLSLFERLLSRYHDDPSVTYMLTKQGRMHRDIADFPSRAFYGGRLTEVPLPHQRRPSLGKGLLSKRLSFIDVKPDANTPSDKVNTAEAKVIASVVGEIYRTVGTEHFDPDMTVGVIVPYRNQIAAVRKALETLKIPELLNISIDTVERYQGSQRDYIVYGFTIQRHYQLDFLTDNRFMDAGQLIDRKLNVAMTRAREYLILVGNADLLATDPLFKQLLSVKGKR